MHEGFNVGQEEKFEIVVESEEGGRNGDLDKAEAPIRQGAMEFIELGEAPPPIADP